MAHPITREAFPHPHNLKKTYKTARKVIDKLAEGNYKWSIGCTEDGQFFPHIIMSVSDCEFSFHYFVSKGCCVSAY